MTKTFKELRETRFASQVECARALGVSKATVCGWETGKRTPSIKQIMQLTKIFKVHRYVVFDIFVANINDSN